MHTAGNRLLVFARKPAPVQVTYLAYCCTTGLDAMDYRLTDPYLDPPRTARTTHATPRTDSGLGCRTPTGATRRPTSAPAVGPPPCAGRRARHVRLPEQLRQGHAPALAVWAPATAGRADVAACCCTRARAATGSGCGTCGAAGVDPARLSSSGRSRWRSIWRCTRDIDIALDPFPYAGGTTTCDALWMGVPVVSLAGGTAVSRGGPEHPVQRRACRSLWRGRRSSMWRSRRTWRGTGGGWRAACDPAGPDAASPLMDAPGFARGVEAAYRHMWHRWCGTCTQNNSKSTSNVRRQGRRTLPGGRERPRPMPWRCNSAKMSPGGGR